MITVDNVKGSEKVDILTLPICSLSIELHIGVRRGKLDRSNVSKGLSSLGDGLIRYALGIKAPKGGALGLRRLPEGIRASLAHTYSYDSWFQVAALAVGGGRNRAIGLDLEMQSRLIDVNRLARRFQCSFKDARKVFMYKEGGIKGATPILNRKLLLSDVAVTIMSDNMAAISIEGLCFTGVYNSIEFAGARCDLAIAVLPS